MGVQPVGKSKADIFGFRSGGGLLQPLTLEGPREAPRVECRINGAPNFRGSPFATGLDSEQKTQVKTRFHLSSLFRISSVYCWRFSDLLGCFL